MGCRQARSWSGRLAVVPQRRRRDDDRFDHGTGHDDHPHRRQRDSRKDAGSACWSAFEHWYVKCGRDARKMCPRGERGTPGHRPVVRSSVAPGISSLPLAYANASRMASRRRASAKPPPSTTGTRSPARVPPAPRRSGVGVGSSRLLNFERALRHRPGNSVADANTVGHRLPDGRRGEADCCQFRKAVGTAQPDLGSKRRPESSEIGRSRTRALASV